ncbi:bifunctional isocitrate dehydrogenase kinase/phosphatase [Algoriphagus namhaensis]
MSTTSVHSLGEKLALHILAGFDSYTQKFHALTELAPEFFKSRNWEGSRQNHLQRLRLYKDVVFPLSQTIQAEFGPKAQNPQLWRDTKEIYKTKIRNLDNLELAETFFNTVIRKSLPTRSVDEELMFVVEGHNSCEIKDTSDLLNTYPSHWGLEKIIRQILSDYHFDVPWMNQEEDVAFLIRSVKEVILSRYRVAPSTKTQILKSVFYRNKAAYLIGRTFLGHKWMPFIIPIMNGPEGIFVDTLIFDPNMMSHLFSFTRSYFMVQAPIPSQVVGFLHAVIPHKKIHELYNAIGYNKHGKTLLYRDFLYHLSQSKDQFILAPGVKGMVMTVFTLPSLNLVFKCIKDHFEPPKNMTRHQVRQKYKLVSLHDRVGRMADTHEFDEFALPLDRVSKELLQELKNTINSLLEIRDNHLIIKHLYTERKMIPLNVFLEECSIEDGKEVVEDYGRAILQLAQANIFPGDMLTKNFGLTRQKRVVFYDYDEIEFLLDMNFRYKPKAETYEQIYAPEPWYHIGKNDVFPEDFKRWMIGREDLRPHFLGYHHNLFDAAYWQKIQQTILNGDWKHTFPYPEEIRFRPRQKV